MQEQFRQLEFDLFVLNIVNDYASLYKQIHSSKGLAQFISDNNILHDNKFLVNAIKQKHEIIEAFNQIFDLYYPKKKEKETHEESDEISLDGNYKCEGMLTAITVSEDIHIRPLCTSADVALALNELQDPRVFREGYIVIPHVLQMNLERFMDGFYRCEYHAKEGMVIKYMK